MIPISLAYAPSSNEHLYLDMTVAEGTQILQALQQSGWLERYPDLLTWCQEHALDSQVNKKAWRVGVFADKKLLTYALKPHDRVEIYRPLTIDPMRKRKKRAI